MSRLEELLCAKPPTLPEQTSYTERELAEFALLDLEAQKTLAYAERNACVAAIAALAMQRGWRAGLGKHDPNDATWDADWRNIVFVDLPGNAQISWHIHDSELADFAFLPPYEGEWDGHTTAEKYARLKRLSV